jgi:hypothetical protein
MTTYLQPATPHIRGLHVRFARMWQVVTAALIRARWAPRDADRIYGNPLHEAWHADGEPLDRQTPAQSARATSSRFIIVPHGRGR